MREAGRLCDLEQAQGLSDYLLTEGIDNEVEKLGDEWVIWIYREEELERAQADLATFQRDPRAKKFGGRARRAGAIRKVEAKAEKQAEENFVDVRRGWVEQAKTWRPITLVLIVLCMLVAALTELGEATEPGSVLQHLTIAPYSTSGNLVRWFGLTAVTDGEVWRLLTPIFLHFGIVHLAFNLLMLSWIGNQVESRRGAVKLILFVIVIALPSNLAQYLASSPNFGGMSGVLYGLLAYAYLKSRYEPQLGLQVSRNTMLFMLGLLLLGFTGMLNFANGAHLIGLLMGGAIAGVPIIWRNLRR